jgi:hypothetical protein
VWRSLKKTRNVAEESAGTSIRNSAWLMIPQDVGPSTLTGLSQMIERRRPLRWLRIFGPGLSQGHPMTTQVASQRMRRGAQLGIGLLWTMMLTYPLMAAIQEVSARVRRVTGRGLAANLRQAYPGGVLCLAVGCW